MERKEELQMLKREELVDICKNYKLPHCRGKARIKKDELIETILEAESTKKGTNETKSAVDENKIDNHQVVEVEVKEEKQSTDNIDARKLYYITQAEIGTIVACKIGNKMKSAKIIKRSTKKERFMVETAHGAQYIVPYEDVVWVRTGRKWPGGVYRALKGLAPEANVARGSENEKAD